MHGVLVPVWVLKWFPARKFCALSDGFEFALRVVCVGAGWEGGKWGRDGEAGRGDGVDELPRTAWRRRRARRRAGPAPLQQIGSGASPGAIECSGPQSICPIRTACAHCSVQIPHSVLIRALPCASETLFCPPCPRIGVDDSGEIRFGVQTHVIPHECAFIRVGLHSCVPPPAPNCMFPNRLSR